MTNTDWIELVSAAATLGSTLLAFVALWKQQSSIKNQLELQSRLMQIQQFSDYTKRYQEITFNFPEEINESTFSISTHEEYRKIMRSMRNYFDLCYEEWQLHERGFLDKETWMGWRAGMKSALSKPAFRQAWAIIRKDTHHGDAFEKFFADLVNA